MSESQPARKGPSTTNFSSSAFAHTLLNAVHARDNQPLPPFGILNAGKRWLTPCPFDNLADRGTPTRFLERSISRCGYTFQHCAEVEVRDGTRSNLFDGRGNPCAGGFPKMAQRQTANICCEAVI